MCAWSLGWSSGGSRRPSRSAASRSTLSVVVRRCHQLRQGCRRCRSPPAPGRMSRPRPRPASAARRRSPRRAVGHDRPDIAPGACWTPPADRAAPLATSQSTTPAARGTSASIVRSLRFQTLRPPHIIPDREFPLEALVVHVADLAEDRPLEPGPVVLAVDPGDIGVGVRVAAAQEMAVVELQRRGVGLPRGSATIPGSSCPSTSACSCACSPSAASRASRR